MRITLVISSLSGGGAERVISILANYWADHGENVTLITIDSKATDFYQLSQRIQRVALDLSSESKNIFSAILNNLARLKNLRFAVFTSKPEAVICFLDRTCVLTLVATRGLRVPVIVSEHTDPRQLPPGGVWNQLRYWTYAWANAVVVLTASLYDVVKKFVPENRLRIIPNPAIDLKDESENSLSFELPKQFFVAMGRLVPLKGFDLLLESFAKCNYKDWSLVILGEGQERSNLESMADQLGLGKNVLFPGRVINPSVVLKKAEFFVLSSRIEGFPMALIEAMSCGLAVISFDCKTGPNEIITNGADGILVPAEDITGLTTAIQQMMKDKKRRKRLGENAQKVVQIYSIERVMKQWDTLLKDTIT